MSRAEVYTISYRSSLTFPLHFRCNNSLQNQSIQCLTIPLYYNRFYIYFMGNWYASIFASIFCICVNFQSLPSFCRQLTTFLSSLLWFYPKIFTLFTKLNQFPHRIPLASPFSHFRFYLKQNWSLIIWQCNPKRIKVRGYAISYFRRKL